MVQGFLEKSCRAARATAAMNTEKRIHIAANGWQFERKNRIGIKRWPHWRTQDSKIQKTPTSQAIALIQYI
jgi:hypothetical protein